MLLLLLKRVLQACQLTHVPGQQVQPAQQQQTTAETVSTPTATRVNDAPTATAATLQAPAQQLCCH
jgi:hypothetical protein